LAKGSFCLAVFFSFFFPFRRSRTRRRRKYIRRRPLDGKSKPTGLRCRPDHRQPTVILYNTRDFGVSSNKPVVNHRSLIKMNGPPEVGEQTKVFACAPSVRGLWTRRWTAFALAFTTTAVQPLMDFHGRRHNSRLSCLRILLPSLSPLVHSRSDLAVAAAIT